MSDELRPMANDPSAFTVQSMLDMAEVQTTDSPWLFTTPGTYNSYVLEAFKRDGSERQTLLAVEWPCRVRNTDDERVVRLLIDPVDAAGLVSVIAQSLAWLESARHLGLDR